jgi:hypothetical protein
VDPKPAMRHLPVLLAVLLSLGASPSTWSRAEALVGPDYERQISQRLDACKLDELLPRLRERRVDYRTGRPLGDLMCCAASFRTANLPLPAELDAEAAELAFWYYEHPERPDQHPNERRSFRKTAVRAMAQLGDERALELAIDLDAEGSEGLYWEVVAQVSGPTRVATLERMLPMAEPRQRNGGIALLAEEGEGGLALLEVYIDHADPGAREAAIDALGTSWSLPALERLEAIASEPNRDSMERAGAKVWADRLALRLRHGLCERPPSSLERAWKLDALRAAAVAGRRAQDDAEVERAQQARALLLELGEEALPVMWEGLGSYAHIDAAVGPIWTETTFMAALMTELGEPAVPCLIDMLATGRGWAHPHAAKALADITGHDLGEDSEAWLAWWQARESEQAPRGEGAR